MFPHQPDLNAGSQASATRINEENDLETALRDARHDLRNPISELMGYSDLLLEDARQGSAASSEDPGKAPPFGGEIFHWNLQPHLWQIRRSAARLLDLVNDSLNSRRLRSDLRALDRVQEEINRLCLEIQSTASCIATHALIQTQAGMQKDLGRLLQAAKRLPDMARRLFLPVARGLRVE